MKKDICTIYIARHGETQWNVEKRLQGQLDSQLTENGIEQAKMLAEKLSNVHFDGVFSSDLLRAKRTAEIVVLERKLAVVTSELLRERAFGSFEGKPFESLKEFDEIFSQLKEEEKHAHKMHPEIESDAEIAIRLITFIREIAVRFSGKTLLVVAHGGILRSFLLHIGYATYTQMQLHAVKNTAYVKLETDGADIQITKTEGITLQKGV